MITEETSIEKVNAYIDKQANLDTLRFIACGSVDDGKSTLIGRMLFESQMIFEDQIAILKKESTKNKHIDFSLLVDGLDAEREQGITIDVAYRFFTTDHRKFIVADTPGHEQYTRNMITGASTADVAIILIDARRGVLPQTRRHSIICSTFGIKKIVLAINKMDLVEYSQNVFRKILLDYENFSTNLDFEIVTPIPLSALNGDNIIELSNKTSWYKGPTLMNFLENVDTKTEIINKPLRFPIQMVNRPNQDFRGFSGTLISGKVLIGDVIRVLPSNETAKINNIILYKESLNHAIAGQAVTLTLDRHIDASRGNVIACSTAPPETGDHFEIQLVWMEYEKGYSGRSYIMKIGTTEINAQITKIKHKININTFEKISATTLEINDLAVVNLKTDQDITFEKYIDCKGLGSLILIDRVSNQTVAAGVINFGLRRANNIHKHKLDIDKKARQLLNRHPSKVLWLTGLSGSGKSTIANALEKELFYLGIRTFVLDGDNLRHGLNKDLGFSNADRIENIRRVSEVAKLMVDAGLIVIASFISPFKTERQMARSLFQKDEFIEIFVDTPIEIAESRDPKGLYKKARNGELPNFTGIDSPYEKPENPEIRVCTDVESVETIVKKLIKKVLD